MQHTEILPIVVTASQGLIHDFNTLIFANFKKTLLRN